MKPHLALVALLALLAACTSSSTRSTREGPLTFVAGESPSDGPVVFLRESSPGLVPNRLAVDVVARGAGELHGAALRVTWDPQALAFVRADSGEKWSKSALALAKEGTPGQLALAWTEKGEIGIDASGEVVLGSLVFESRSHQGTPIAFKVERSTVVDKKGARVDVAWRGGSVTAY